METPRSPSAVESAVAAGSTAGFVARDPLVLQDTNNCVVWLRPHEVIAKVGVRPVVRDALRREVDVARYLHAAGAPVGEPLGWFEAGRFPVSLWRRVAVTGAPVSPPDHAGTLAAVHAALRGYLEPLPSFWAATDDAGAALFDDHQMRALPDADLAMLRAEYERRVSDLRSMELDVRPIHGEPHEGNVLASEHGPVVIDFEAASVGPIEWDLGCAPPGVADATVGVDLDVVRAARHLNSVRVATWCWASPHPAMRRYGVDQLENVRRAQR